MSKSDVSNYLKEKIESKILEIKHNLFPNVGDRFKFVVKESGIDLDKYVNDMMYHQAKIQEHSNTLRELDLAFKKFLVEKKILEDANHAVISWSNIDWWLPAMERRMSPSNPVLLKLWNDSGVERLENLKKDVSFRIEMTSAGKALKELAESILKELE